MDRVVVFEELVTAGVAVCPRPCTPIMVCAIASSGRSNVPLPDLQSQSPVAVSGLQHHLPSPQVRAEKPAWYLAVIAGAVLRSLNAVASRAADFLGYLAKGQLPPMHISLTAFQESFVLDGAAWLLSKQQIE